MEIRIRNFDERSPTTLFVGNLHYFVSDELLRTYFSEFGMIRGCQIVWQPGNDPYAFLDFESHQAAATALATMHRRVFFDREIIVNWALSPGNVNKTYISNHHKVFVGNLSPKIDTNTLKEAFAPFGEISNCQIARDVQTWNSKGCAFVWFVNKSDAENAIMAMDGQVLGGRSIRTSWSTRKPPPLEAAKPKSSHSKRPTFEEIFNQTSPTNSTVYCSGVQNGICAELMHEVFSQFGAITHIRVFKDRGHAFIKFTTKECAARAIEAVHSTEVNGYTVRCFWGNEKTGEAASSAGLVMQQTYLPTMYAMGYWYAQAPQDFAAPSDQDYSQATQSAQFYTPYCQCGYQNCLAWMPAAAANWPEVVGGPPMQHQAFNPQNSDDDFFYTEPEMMNPSIKV